MTLRKLTDYWFSISINIIINFITKIFQIGLLRNTQKGAVSERFKFPKCQINIVSNFKVRYKKYESNLKNTGISLPPQAIRCIFQ